MGFTDILSDAVKGIPLAEVLRERLAFAEQQFAALDRETAKLKAEKETLEAENLRLRSDLQKAQEEIATLKKPAPEPAQPRWGSAPRIKGRMEL